MGSVHIHSDMLLVPVLAGRKGEEEMNQDYTMRAQPTKVRGHNLVGLLYDEYEYASKLEASFAHLLIRHRIPFTPHVKFPCIGPTGKVFNFIVDFLFHRPVKLQGCAQHVMAVEVKGVLKPHDFTRAEALKYCHGLRCFIVTEPLIAYYQAYGLDPIVVHKEE